MPKSKTMQKSTSGYHIFFKEERVKLMKMEGIMKSGTLTKQQVQAIARKWRNMDTVLRAHYDLRSIDDDTICIDNPRKVIKSQKEKYNAIVHRQNMFTLSTHPKTFIKLFHNHDPIKSTLKFKGDQENMDTSYYNELNQQQASIIVTIGKLGTHQDHELVDFVKDIFS